MAPTEPQNRHGDLRPSSGGVPDAAGPSDTPAGHSRNEGQSPASIRDARSRSPLTASESWVEIASQPSSSSLSSMGDEIVTTGLRVGSNSYPPRRRRLYQQPLSMPPSYVVGHAAAQAGTSSQEEYDETESEEDDRVMTSSTEAVHPASSLPHQQTAVRAAVDTDTDSDDDENATALGRPSSSPTFRPQPNAFSHPPSHLTHRHSTSSAHPYRPSHSRPSIPGRSHTRPHRNAPDYMSPSFQADNEAALRASLTTLLSCAAAARGLSKKEDYRAGAPSMGPPGAGAGVMPSSQPMELRLVPESELMADDTGPAAHGPGPVHPKVFGRTASNSSAASAPSSASSQAPALQTERSKRAATAQSKPLRATKKKRSGVAVDSDTATFISPTLLTWVMSAGVVVIVSVVGFGAGYVIGREVGRQEGALGSFGSAGVTSNASANCGQELVRSTGTLRRFRWGSVGIAT